MRSLSLKKESLAPLTDDELGGLVGASVGPPQEFRVPTREKCVNTVSDAACYTRVTCP